MVDRVSSLDRLAATTPAREAVRLAALPPASRISVRTAAPGALGLSLGTVLNRSTASGARAALHIGPDEWLLLAPDGEAAALLAAGTGHAAALVDVSHRSATIEIAGPRAADVLNAFCALDLAEAVFPIGMCTRTLLGKAEIVLWRTGAETFRIEVWRSFAPYVWDCLEEAAREFG